MSGEIENVEREIEELQHRLKRLTELLHLKQLRQTMLKAAYNKKKDNE